MKFTDGFWQLRPGVTALYAQQAFDIDNDDRSVVITAPTKIIESRGDTLNRPVLTVRLSAPMPDVIKVRVDHFVGAPEPLRFELVGAADGQGIAAATDDGAELRSGDLVAGVRKGAPWSLTFSAGDQILTSSGPKSIGYVELSDSATVADGLAGVAAPIVPGQIRPRHYLNQQLDLGIGELVYGLGERFGPVIKNGQTVEVWNADGGTSSEQAYKNVPFYLTNRGYGVLVNDPGHVSFEIGSETVERVQFSVPGESLEYLIIHGPTPKKILERYTALTGRPAVPPAWSYGLWLSTSFTTRYDEQTVSSFVDGMIDRGLPLSVFHFDCFWMREFNWCDFTWDPRVFGDPEGMLKRLHERGLHVSVWINPYIGQRSALFAEAAAAGYLVTRPDGSVWQWDLWQAGMGLVDFTNPAATAWYQEQLRRLIGQGVDCFKTDFGERIPREVRYADRSDPARMHNYYSQLYNRAVFEVLQEERGEGDAVLFARSATTGGQRFPVHWGGDSTSSYASMAETLRGGLSLAFSGFGFWSHDIGGFEGMPDSGVFKRWTTFGLLSSHSRFHGSSSYRVPWLFDTDETDPQSAVSVTRRFTRLKLRLMPYLYAAGLEAARTGTPMMRPMIMEFPDDPTAAFLERQYMLGADLLVAPVMSADGKVQFYLPPGRWWSYLTGEAVDGGAWRTEIHGFDSLPLYVREGAVLPLGAVDDRPDYDYLDGLELAVYPGRQPERKVLVTNPAGVVGEFYVEQRDIVRVAGPADRQWSVRLIDRGETHAVIDGNIEI
jgi:alpha-D-xyloside xylohydrolase